MRRPAPRVAPPRRRAPRPANVARRLGACSAAVIVVFSVLAARVAQLQVMSGDRFRRMALAQTLRTIPLTAERGSIFDRNGRDLAMSVQKSAVYVDPHLVTDPIVYAAKLASVLGVPAPTLAPLLADKTHRFKYLAHTVDDDVAAKVTKLGLAGVGLVDESKRSYPASTVAAVLLGSVGGEGRGLDGLEYLYDGALTGKPGEVVVEQDQQGHDIPNTERRNVEARRGTDLVLTIDQSLQWEVEHSLIDEVTATSAHGGMAVVIDVPTGDVLSIASVDGATATAPAHAAAAGEHNQPLQDLFEPGSTMKLVTMSTALEHGVIGPDTPFMVPDKIMVGSHLFSDVEAHPTQRWSPTDVLRESSNVGAIEIAQHLDKQWLADMVRKFGFGTRTPLDFPGQPSGLLLDPARYYDTGLASTAIGYGVAVTAHQLLDAYTTVANGGVARSPRLLSATIDTKGKQHPVLPVPGARVVSAGTAATVTKMLTAVVTSGTGACAAVPGYTTAGKTGTSRKALPTGGYSSETMASFVGFVPAQRPRLAAIVVLDAPANQYGGAASAPVFSEVMQFALTQYRVPPTDPGNVQHAVAQAAAARVGTPCAVPHGADLQSLLAQKAAAATAAPPAPDAAPVVAGTPASLPPVTSTTQP